MVTYIDSELKEGVWKAYPTQGTTVGWEAAGGFCANLLPCSPQNEEGTVVYKVGGGEAFLYFNNPASGKNTCDVKYFPQDPGQAGQGLTSTMLYTFQSQLK